MAAEHKSYRKMDLFLKLKCLITSKARKSKREYKVYRYLSCKMDKY